MKMLGSVALFILVAGLCVVTSLFAADLNLSKAVRIGAGPKTVIEFTDPDCPFCRQASRYLDGRPDVTRYVFFYPLARHPKAKEKAQYILSQTDKARAYHEIMAGKLDTMQGFNVSAKGIRLQEEQLEIVKKAKVNSTPTFMIYGRIITGFDVHKLEEALGK